MKDLAEDSVRQANFKLEKLARGEKSKPGSNLATHKILTTTIVDFP